MIKWYLITYDIDTNDSDTDSWCFVAAANGNVVAET